MNKIIIFIIVVFVFYTKTVSASSVVINEFMPHPSPGSDWIELYNPTSNDINLTNWLLVDSTSTMKTLSGSISAQGFITFDVNNRLNNSGDSIYLKDNNGNTVDNYSYNSDPGVNISFGRSPDGGNWTILASSSKGSSNGVSSSTPSPSLSPSPTPTSTPAPTRTSSPAPIPKKSTSPTDSPSTAPSPSPSTDPPNTPDPSKTPIATNKLIYYIASVAAATTSATPSGKVEIKNEKQTNPLVWVGLFFIFAGIGTVGYIYLIKNAKIHIPFGR